jgi:phosphohistidine phosphatase
MELYLIRHAHALDGEDDSRRPLSPRGRKQVKALTKFLASSGALQPAEIWHSGLDRARETAELLVEGLELPAKLFEKPGLMPEDDPALLIARLNTLHEPLAIVGHEPFLSALATLLVGGGAGGIPIFVMRKSTIIALEGTGSLWQVRWQLAPELLA